MANLLNQRSEISYKTLSLEVKEEAIIALQDELRSARQENAILTVATYLGLFDFAGVRRKSIYDVEDEYLRSVPGYAQRVSNLPMEESEETLRRVLKGFKPDK